MFDELGIRKRRRKIEVADNHSNQSPKNRQWLHDTPGAINEAQVHLRNTHLVVELGGGGLFQTFVFEQTFFFFFSS